MSTNYTVFHLHSDMSNGVTNIDSITKYQDYVARAKELGMEALAFSEHGSVFDWHGKKEAIEKAGMKYIHAEEFYVTEKIETNEEGSPIKLRDNYHCVLIAKNYEGVKEINRLASKSFNRSDGHYYYAPRITYSDLIGTTENVIISTACLGGILHKGNGEIRNDFLEFLCKNKHRCFLEIQHHNVEDQKSYNLELVELHNKYKIPLIAGTDTHSLNEEHAEGRKILQLSKNIRFGEEDGWDLTFKSYEELCNAYEKQGVLPKDVYLKAIENTNVMANMVETFTVDRSTKYPHIYDNPEKTFREKTNKAYKSHPYLKERYPKELVSRQVKEEFEVYKKVGAIDFMLLETYLKEWEKKNGIQSGYGRGSVSGSLIAYILGITQMDSLKFNLNFFRFMNPDRVTNADIDTDYSSKDRDKVKQFLLRDHLDLEHIKTSEIITFNTIATKGAIKDVCRALHISVNEAQQISDAVNTDGTIDDEWKEKYPEVFKYVDLVSGTIVSIGSHPSGVLVSDRNIEEDVGLCSLSTSDYPVSMLDMHGLDDQMYVKLDILGLDNIGVINECCKLIGIDRLTPDNVDLDDENVWDSIRDDTTMIFQWESESAAAYLKKFMSEEVIGLAKGRSKDFSYIKWFSFGNGLIRPACASYRDEVANGVFYDNGFKELNNFLAPEAGRVCMQETIMQFLVKFCGYSNADSDNVRRGIAKKKGTEQLLPEIERRFIEYSSTHYDISEEKCREVIKPFLEIILSASSYAFSWNHSDSYSCTGYICGYLRYYYPLEFLTAAFNVFVGKEDKIAAITNYAKKVGIPIKPVKFRYSKAEYNMDKATNSIYKGLTSIKFMNSKVADALYEMKDMEFKSFIDLLTVFPGNSRQREILITLNFFEEFGKAKKLLKIAELYDTYYGRKQIPKKSAPEEYLEIIEKYSEATEKQYRKFDYIPALREMCEALKDEDICVGERLKCEIEYLGYLETTLPDLSPDYYFVQDYECKFKNPKLVLYCLCDGSTETMKVKHKEYSESPMKVGDIIKVRERKKEGKWSKDANGEWQQDKKDKELWLKKWSFIK